jgi:hypothetical protein
MADAEDPHAQISWRRVKALALANLGALDDAERLAREAVSIAHATNARIHRGDSSLALGMVLQHAGQTEEAISAFRNSEREFLIKGDVVSAALARAQAAQTASAS